MNKPKVFVLMAIYNPNLDWLKEQLSSINSQTYNNIELIACDDCSQTIESERLNALLKQSMTRFPYNFISNETNLGSNKTFERLTMEAGEKAGEQNEETYLAYCDQDDIWEPQKIEILINEMIQKNAVLAYSDMSVIDSEGKLVSDSITKIRKRFDYFEGKDLWKKILIRNFISGCCMVVRTDIALAAVPFEANMQHDRWISVIASAKGYIAYVDNPLVRYRQHGMNQTGVLKDITDKASYIQIRIKEHMKTLENIKRRADINGEMKQFLSQYIEQMQIRLEYAEGRHLKFFKMLRLIEFNRATIIFEIIAMKLPEKMFIWALNIIKNMNMS